MLSLLALTVVAGSQKTIGGLPPGPVSLDGLWELNGKKARVLASQSKATVLMYLGTECPIANRYAPEINRIVSKYTQKGATFIRIYVEALDMAPSVRQHGLDFQLKMVPYLDPDRLVMKRLGVSVTPEIVILDHKSKAVYRGRIDGQNVEHGKVQENYRRDLRVALDEVLAGKAVSVPVTTAIGCYIGATN